jgi:esterase/lipase superfamily enzyme
MAARLARIPSSNVEGDRSMGIGARIILDSGSFISPKEELGYPSCRVGYFQCQPYCPDVRIYVDGEEIEPLKLSREGGMGSNVIDIVHVKAKGKGKALAGVKNSATIDKQLLRRSDLYNGKDVGVDEEKFDWILQFHDGSFRSSMVKARYFKEVDANGSPLRTRRRRVGPIAHDVVVSYDLADGDELKLVRDGQTLLSSKSLKGLRSRLDLEILAEDDTALKYYLRSIGKRESYWVPNQGQPPPTIDAPSAPRWPTEMGPVAARRSALSNQGQPPPGMDASDREAIGLTAAKAFIEVPIFYATDRLRTGSEDPNKFYGYQWGELECGLCEVSIPKAHVFGKIERPEWWKLEFKENPRKHIALLTITPMERNGFWSALRSVVARSDQKDAFIFVHGFNVTFAQAARRTAQLACDLGFGGTHGAPIMYSWPSKGDLDGYLYDEDSVRWATQHLQTFIAEAGLASQASRIHLISHSMGSLALTEAVRLFALGTATPGERFSHIILAAPDINAKVFSRDICAAFGVSSRITLYASSKDKALVASRRIRGIYPRAGESGNAIVVLDGMDTVDASDVGTDMLGHGYFAKTAPLINDIHSLLINDLPPDKRNLRSRDKDGLKYWAFPRSK